MTFLVHLAMFGWPLLGILAFRMLPARKAVLLVVIGGWLFLPTTAYPMPGLPDYTKGFAIVLGAALGMLFYAGHWLDTARFGWCDLPMLAWCLVPAASSYANGHPMYDAVSVTLGSTVEWGLPYLFGRVLFRDLGGIDKLARGLFIGGLVYVPFCLYEVRMSPQLHATVYGFAQHSFNQHMRGGGYRPLVFMEHGLMVGLWMAAASIAGFSLWRYGGLRRLFGMPVLPLLLLLGGTTVLCKSLGALVLMGVGIAAVVALRRTGGALPGYTLMAVPAVFVGARVLGGWQAKEVVELIGQHAPERASSVAFRIRSEEAFMSGIWEHPLLGWSAWGFTPPMGPEEEPLTYAFDSFWLITVTCFGLIGLTLFFVVHYAPITSLLRHTTQRRWAHPRMAGVAALVAVVCIFVADCMFNAMINPIYTVVVGGLVSLASGVTSRAGEARSTMLVRDRMHAWS
ncbi:MAG TPA: O-antigen ligase domain-containing protein [Planctomycetota bacterium]